MLTKPPILSNYKGRKEEHPSEGRSYSSEATLLPKDNLTLPKVVQDNCFGRSILRRFQKFRASEYQMLLKTLLSNFLRKTKTSEEIPSSKTVAEHFQSTKEHSASVRL
ncbi:hypothetical protein E3N88_17241 [Mikania micrantha]|uniref:Uncharacterized protein n=1 Tax=Mikania micrantha TaxID=192012 RepID=A0A5N6NTJ2_9ASTR|nr:hypothetical protein E3N88_17241 [Mikania micrantha]